MADLGFKQCEQIMNNITRNSNFLCRDTSHMVNKSFVKS